MLGGSADVVPIFSLRKSQILLLISTILLQLLLSSLLKP